MKELFYLQCTKLQRFLFALLIACFVCFACYEKKMVQNVKLHHTALKKLVAKKNMLLQHQKLIAAIPEIQKQLARNQNALSQNISADNFLEFAKQNSIDDIQLTTIDSQKKSILINAHWQELLTFIQKIATNHTKYFPTTLNVDIQGIDTDADALAELIIKKSDPLEQLTNTQPLFIATQNNSTIDALNPNDLQWLGYLLVNDEPLIFYRLPNGKYHALKLNETIEQSHWQLTNIKSNALLFRDPNQGDISVPFTTKGLNHANADK